MFCKTTESKIITLFPSGVKRIFVTAPPDCLGQATCREMPNSHMYTEPSIDPVKTVRGEEREKENEGREEGVVGGRRERRRVW